MKFFLDILKIYSNVISAIIGALLTYILDKRLEKNKLKEADCSKMLLVPLEPGREVPSAINV